MASLTGEITPGPVEERSMAAKLASSVHRTVSVVKDVSIEMQSAGSLSEASGILLRKDRKIYVGYALVAIALLSAAAMSE